MDTWFATVLERAGLPAMYVIRQTADEEVGHWITEEMLPGPVVDPLTQLLSVGRKHQLKYGLRLNGPYEGIDEITPPILLSDGTIIPGKNSPKFGAFAEPDRWIEDAWRYSNSLQEFLDACLV